MNVAQRRSLARPAGAAAVAVDLLAEAAELGGAGCVAEHLAHVLGRAERTPAIGVERMLHRRQFCPGEKRGDKVSKTKRGKGTKWMVVVDGTGVPLGNHMDSASPAEVKLAENTLATILVPHGSPEDRPRQ